MKKISLLILLAVMASCNPRARFTRLIDRHPYLLTTDTLTIHDTVKVEVPRVVHDTIINEHFFTEITKDTLILEKERLTVKIFHDTIKRNVFIEGECDTVTVEKIVDRKIPVKYYERYPWYKKLISIVLFILLTLLLVYITYRLIKKYTQ